MFFILDNFFLPGWWPLLFFVFNQTTRKNTTPANPAGKLLELPGNTVEGAQQNIGRTYDVAAFTTVLGRLGDEG